MKKKVLRKTKCKEGGNFPLLTFAKVKGAPIFVEGTGKIVGKIADLVLSKEKASVIGVFLFVKKWRAKHRFLLWEDIVRNEKGNFSILSATALTTMPDGVRRFSNGNERLHGKLIIEIKGDEIGIIEDVYFLPDSGKIVGYELTEGLFSDLKNGIKMLKYTMPLVEQENSFVIKSR